MKVLIVEIVPFISETIRDILKYFRDDNINARFKVSVENDFEIAYSNVKRENLYDYYFINFYSNSYQAMTFKEKSIITYDEKLALWIRKHYPEAKLGIITGITSKYRLVEIFKKFNPDVFLIKQETWLADLSKMAFDISLGRKYFSPMLKNIISMKFDTDYGRIDHLDMRIVYHLSNGCPTNQLPEFVPLTISGIEKRKRKLAKLFGLSTSKSFEIVRAARNRGVL
ncbi:hypothetical protein [Maribacter sp. IgM3_T14_3]|uniref:hypothetical protein n=1 Tax=Maribacter sp. IgM3_T14_3 TaxID=3415140 RepID=UPI003C705F5B